MLESDEPDGLSAGASVRFVGVIGRRGMHLSSLSPAFHHTSPLLHRFANSDRVKMCAPDRNIFFCQSLGRVPGVIRG
jgi:hypothetical protein